MSEFGHMGIFVRDIKAMEEFYSEVLGLEVTDRGEFKGRALVFLSGSEHEHHQVVLAEGRDDGTAGQVLNQLSIKAESLTELRAIGSRLEASGVPDESISAVDHGTAWSLYFPDPDGNRIELYTPTPYYVPQPAAEPLDLTLSDAELAAKTNARFGDRVGFQPIADWQDEFRRRKSNRTAT